MKALLQRVKSAEVNVEGESVGEIGKGLLILLGIAEGDDDACLEKVMDKLINLRVFNDENGKMNRSILDTEGEICVVSQFTLHADCRKGRRPSFVGAASPDKAYTLYQRFVDQLQTKGIRVATGQFGAMMEVSLINDGPVTILLDSNEL